MAEIKKIPISIRLDEDVVERLDEVAKMMGMKRATYCQYVLENWHSEKFNPIDVAQMLIENMAKYADKE